VLDYCEHTGIDLFAMNGKRCGLRALRRSHYDDAEPTSSAGFAIDREIDLGDITVRGTQVPQSSLGRGGGKVANI